MDIVQLLPYHIFKIKRCYKGILENVAFKVCPAKTLAISNFNLQFQSTLQNSSQSKEVNDWVDLKWVPVVNNLDFRSENLSCLHFATDDSDLLSKLWIVDISNAHLGFLTAALNPKCTSLVKNTSRRVNNLQYGSAVFNWSDGGKTGAYGEYSPILFRPHRNTWWKGIKWTLSKTISKVESWKRQSSFVDRWKRMLLKMVTWKTSLCRFHQCDNVNLSSGLSLGLL